VSSVNGHNGSATSTGGKWNSGTITNGRDRAGARAMFKAIGFTDEDLAKPLVGIAHTWIETMPCGYNLRELVEHVKRGVREAGGTPMEFNTIAISDGITMGTEGMKASLVSREVIADSIELVGRGYMFDAIVGLFACDKTGPGTAMALMRLNAPAVMLYGGTIAPGKFNGVDLTLGDVYEAIGAHSAGRSRITHVPAPAPAPASSPRTRWRPSSSFWGSRRSGALARRRWIRARLTKPIGRAKS
jgi:dihydroxy-acid dehydratase